MDYSWIETIGIGFGAIAGCVGIVVSIQAIYWRLEQYNNVSDSSSDYTESSDSDDNTV